MVSKKYMRIFIIFDILFMFLVTWLIIVNGPTEVRMRASVKEAVTNQMATQTVLESSLSNIESSYEGLKSRTLCNQYLSEVDYSDEETVVTALKEFIRLTGGDVIESNEWTSVFVDSQPTFHSFYSKDYAWAYVVYIRDSKTGIDGIFDIANACWVNLSKVEKALK
jgi:hypothetical protein